MSKKEPKTEADLRAELELRAAQKRAQEAADRAQLEAKQVEQAKNVYDNIWLEFAKDSKKSRSLAYSNLKQNLAEFASYLVPYLLTAKEHMALITEAEQHIKGEGQHAQEDPRSLVGSWLRGETELSRIPLEKTVIPMDT